MSEIEESAITLKPNTVAVRTPRGCGMFGKGGGAGVGSGGCGSCPGGSCPGGVDSGSGGGGDADPEGGTGRTRGGWSTPGREHTGQPLPFFSFTGSRASIRGDLNFYGKTGVQFFTNLKTVVSQWKFDETTVSKKATTAMPTMN